MTDNCEGDSPLNKPDELFEENSLNLQFSESDIPQEIITYRKILCELQESKLKVSEKSKQNHFLTKFVQDLDSKIGLLINHRITIEEIANLCQKRDMPESVKADKQYQLISNLFYLLQTTPRYVATLTRAVTIEEIESLLETVMFSLYGNQYEEREEHLLLAMFHLAVTKEIQSAQDFGTLMRNNSAMTRMMSTYTRRPPGTDYLKTTFSSLLEEVSLLEESCEINSISVLEELKKKRGVTEKRRATQEEADSDPETQNIVQTRLVRLREYIERLIIDLYNSIDRVPYGIRFLCKTIKTQVEEKFENPQDKTTIMVGGFFFLRFLNPIIAAPFNCHIVSKRPTEVGRRVLTLIAKSIQTISNHTMTREPYMKQLEPFLLRNHDSFKEFLHKLCDVPEFHQLLEMEAYLALSRKQLQLELRWKEVLNIHSLLVKYEDMLIADSEDKLAILLNELNLQFKLKEANIYPEVAIQLPLESFWPDSPDESIFSLDNPENSYKFAILLLSKIFKITPQCLQEKSLTNALNLAMRNACDEGITLSEIAIKKIRPMLESAGDREALESKIFEDVKASIPSLQDLISQNTYELNRLMNILQDMDKIEKDLIEKLDAYDEYLVQVRKSATTSLYSYSKRDFKFTFAQLCKEGVIVSAIGVPEKRRNNLYFQISVIDIGIFKLSVFYEGRDTAISTHDFGLEELLEHQFLLNPTIDFDYITISAKNLLMLIYRTFSINKS